MHIQYVKIFAKVRCTAILNLSYENLYDLLLDKNSEWLISNEYPWMNSGKFYVNC